MRQVFRGKRRPDKSGDELRSMRLSGYVVRYLVGRDVTENYWKLTQARVRLFIEWYGEDVLISELTCEMVNAWLTAAADSKLSKVTISNYRRAFHAVMHCAYMEGASDEAPWRLKKIKTSRLLVECYSLREIRSLIATAAKLPGFLPNGVKRSDFWQGLLHGAYSTGLRRGDLLAVLRSQIGEDGRATVVQSKTGHVVCVKFSPETRDFIAHMVTPRQFDDRAFPWPFHENALPRQFRALVKLSGVRRGTFKWLRRSAGSHSEAEQRGNGPALLGHRSEAVFRAHYEDPTITKATPIEPPSLRIADAS
jgi:integrase